MPTESDHRWFTRAARQRDLGKLGPGGLPWVLQNPTRYPLLGTVMGFLDITMATINVVGGYLVTDRMLGMFGSKKKKKG